MDSVMKGLLGQCPPPRIFGIEPPLGVQTMKGAHNIINLHTYMVTWSTIHSTSAVSAGKQQLLCTAVHIRQTGGEAIVRHSHARLTRYSKIYTIQFYEGPVVAVISDTHGVLSKKRAGQFVLILISRSFLRYLI